MIGQQDATKGSTIDGIVLVSSSWAHILFDTGESHSFIFALFLSILGLEFETLDLVISMGVPLGKGCELSYGCSFVRVKISGQQCLTYLVVMLMEQFDVILGMDWLSRYWAVINCARRRVNLHRKNG